MINGFFFFAMVITPICLLAYLSLKSGFNYIVKDNYRYILPFSLMVQVLLLQQFLGNTKSFLPPVRRWLVGIAFFWVCVYPGAWSVQALAQKGVLNTHQSEASFPLTELKKVATGKHLSIYFFLNGHGPRLRDVFRRESHFSFILDGQKVGGAPFQTSKPIRVIVAVEGNLEPSHQSVQEFLGRFPEVNWEKSEVPGSLFPTILYADMEPDSPSL